MGPAQGRSADEQERASAEVAAALEFRVFNLQEDLDAALAMASRASHLALRYFQMGVAWSSKRDGSPVTEADRAVEELLRQELGERRPLDAILGEELGHTGHHDALARVPHDRTWIIDPIDGTSSFIKRSVDWRVQLALEIDGRVAVAVVDAPAQGVRWWASSGGGAFESTQQSEESPVTRRLSVSATAEPGDTNVQAYPLDNARQRLMGWNVAKLDSVVPCEVVRGLLDAFILEGSEAWDHAPWILLVEEAGGRFTDWDGGHSAHRRGGLFSNARVHPALATALGLVRR